MLSTKIKKRIISLSFAGFVFANLVSFETAHSFGEQQIKAAALEVYNNTLRLYGAKFANNPSIDDLSDIKVVSKLARDFFNPSFNGLPTVIPTEQFNEIPGDQKYYRGISAYETENPDGTKQKVPAKTLFEQFTTGEYFPGQAYGGIWLSKSGWYSDLRPGQLISACAQYWARVNCPTREDEGIIASVAFDQHKLKIIKKSELDKINTEYHALIPEVFDNSRVRAPWENFMYIVGIPGEAGDKIRAELLKQQGIWIDDGTNTYSVILDRSALSVEATCSPVKAQKQPEGIDVMALGDDWYSVPSNKGTVPPGIIRFSEAT
ncbi:MAG: hypothetical protein LBJ95_03965 [Oscillospiraceae bacterium]|jgi:hypothetical protein|nr:hypothetical protein [Oscillospiraceae bacterium]